MPFKPCSPLALITAFKLVKSSCYLSVQLGFLSCGPRPFLHFPPDGGAPNSPGPKNQRSGCEMTQSGLWGLMRALWTEWSCDLLAVGRQTGAADFAPWESNKKITGPIMVQAVISAFTLLCSNHVGFLVFFFVSPSLPCGSAIASRGGLIRLFLWLVCFCENKPPGQVVFDYSAVMWWAAGLRGSIVID